jgi:hypothetical protein
VVRAQAVCFAVLWLVLGCRLESEYFAGIAAAAGALVPGFEALLDRSPGFDTLPHA